MFTKNKYGAGMQFRFSEILSALRKSLQRGNLDLAVEMAKEFRDYPGVLQRTLVRCCCEFCPNIFLVRDIQKAKPKILHLLEFIPAICLHVKCQEAMIGFRVACEGPHNFEPFSPDDNDLLTLLTKCYTSLCQHDMCMDKILEFFGTIAPSTVNVWSIYVATSKKFSIIYLLCAWKCIPYVTEPNYRKPSIYDYYENGINLNDFPIVKLPAYIYDRSVLPPTHKNSSNEFYLRNLVLYPRMPKTELELEGERLLLSSNRHIMSFIRPILQCKKLIVDDEGRGKVVDGNKVDGKDKYSHGSIKVDGNDHVNDHVNTDGNDHVNDHVNADGNDHINDHINDLNSTSTSTTSHNLNLIQIYLQRKKHYAKVFYCDLDHNGKFEYILKGPYIFKNYITARLLADYLKKKVGLTSLDSTLVEYKSEYYILSKNFVYVNPENVEFRKGVNDAGQVYSGERYWFYNHRIVQLTPEQIIDLFKILVFKKAIGTKDVDHTSILLHEDKLFSVGDDLVCKDRKYVFTFAFRNDRLTKTYKKELKKVFPIINEFIQNFAAIVNSDELLGMNEKIFITGQLMMLMKRSNWKFDEF